MANVNPGPAATTNINQTFALTAPTASAQPSYTYATLPKASTVTAGTIAYTTDKGQVTSNGTTWIAGGSSVVSTIKAALAASSVTNSITAQPLIAPVAWATATTYQTGQAVTNAGNCYICLNGSTPSGATAPTGTGSALINDGGCTWYYWGPSYTSSAVAPTVGPVNFAARYTGTYYTTNNNTYAVGSPRVFNTSNFFFYGCAGADGGGGNNSSYTYNLTGLIGGISFMTDAPAFQIVLNANTGPSINVYVNGIPCTLGMTFYSTSNQFFQMVFPDRRPRQITVEVQAQLIQAFYGVLVNDTISKVWAPSNTPTFALSIVGTSYMDGSGQHPVTASLGLGSQIARYLGCTNYWVDKFGSGTGYINSGGTNGTFAAASRFSALIPTNPDVLIISGGGVNDYTLFSAPAGNSALQTEQAAAVAYYAQVRAALPNVIMLVIGSEAGSQGPSAAILNMELAVQQAVAQFNDPYCFYIPQSYTTTSSAWISGTGTTAATNGSGNSDVMIGPDSIHPVQLGVNYLAYQSANAIRKVLNSLS